MGKGTPSEGGWVREGCKLKGEEKGVERGGGESGGWGRRGFRHMLSPLIW